MMKLSVHHSTTSVDAIKEISKSRSAWCRANHMPPIEKSGFLIIPATRLSTKPYTLRAHMCVIENNFTGVLALQHSFFPMILRTVMAATGFTQRGFSPFNDLRANPNRTLHDCT